MEILFIAGTMLVGGIAWAAYSAGYDRGRVAVLDELVEELDEFDHSMAKEDARMAEVLERHPEWRI